MQSTSWGNTGLEEAQAGIKIAGRHLNNLRYADDTTLMAESEEELKSLLMKVKECRCQPAKLIRSRECARRHWERKLKLTTAKMGSRGSDTSPRRDAVWPWLYSASYIYTGECEKDKTVSIFLGWSIHLTKSHKQSWEHGNGTLLLFLTPDNISLCMRSLSRTPGVCSK